MSGFVRAGDVAAILDYAGREFCECEYVVRNIREEFERLEKPDVIPLGVELWGKDGEVNMVNCKECANKRCKNNGFEHAAYNCPDFMVTIKGGVDMVKVIRCKDCKHWNKRVVSGEWPDKVTCACKIVQHYTQKGWTRYTAQDDYCSFAERVEEND